MKECLVELRYPDKQSLYIYKSDDVLCGLKDLLKSLK